MDVKGGGKLLLRLIFLVNKLSLGFEGLQTTVSNESKEMSSLMSLTSLPVSLPKLSVHISRLFSLSVKAERLTRGCT